jgi:hypothetical protein
MSMCRRSFLGARFPSSPLPYPLSTLDSRLSPLHSPLPIRGSTSVHSPPDYNDVRQLLCSEAWAEPRWCGGKWFG